MGVKDETGHIYGHLTVLQRAGSKNGKATWLCQCDCGNTKVITGDELRRGAQTSCGCQATVRGCQVGKNNAKNLTGQLFGRLLAIEPIDSNKNGVIWKCECQCEKHNIHYVSATNLLQGRVKSCGCLVSSGEANIQNLLDKYGIIYVTQFTPEGWRFLNGNCPYFDFGIFKNGILNCLIEFQGEQHYKYYNHKTTWNNQENFERTQYRDQQKRDMCKENNIPLYEIPYTKIDSLEEEILKIIVNQNLQNE